MSLGLSGYQDMDKTKERWERFWIEVERMPTLPTLHNNTLRVEEICPSCYKEQANSWGWVRGVSITSPRRVFAQKSLVLTFSSIGARSSRAHLSQLERFDA